MWQNKVNDRMKEMKDLILNSNKSICKYDEDELTKAYEEIYSRYSEIRLHRLWSNRIGEYIPRYMLAAGDAEKNKANGILDLFVLSDYVRNNQRLTEIMGRHIHIIDAANIEMWLYILQRFPKVEFDKYWNDYRERSKDALVELEQVAPYFALTEEEIYEGERKKDLMGLHDPFVCVSSRDSMYLSVANPTMDARYHDYRDSDINRLKDSAGYLAKRDIVAVRMGRYVEGNAEFENCIDYANKYYDELMDIVLMRDCKFFVGDSNGVSVVPMALNKPVAMKNVVPVFLDVWGWSQMNPQSMYIFKKYYKKSENRFLSVREMMKVEKKVQCNGRRYAKMGIEVVENSEEEILDLTVEMNERLDGTWVETAEDMERQKQYDDLLREWCIKENYKWSALLHAKVGTLFLRKNPFLLENSDDGD